MNKFLKRYIIGIFIVGCFLFHMELVHGQRITYYVSSLTGNDRNNGLSPTTAWKTIEEVNRMLPSIRAGNSILFERGGIYYGSIRIPSSVRGNADYPITFGAYGEGDMPVVSGAKQISNWERTGNNLWKANVPDRPASIDVLFINGKKYYPARYPNKGYLYVTDRYTKGFQDKNLTSPDGYWNGATVAFKTNDWTIYRDTVAYSYRDGRIDKIGRNADKTPGPGWGYFFQNHINALDTIGEFVYDKRAGTLTLCANKDPNEQLAEYMDADYGVRIDYSSSSNRICYIHVENLCFQHYREFGLYVRVGNHFTARRNIIKNCKAAIYAGAFNNCFILENTIYDIDNVGINFDNVRDSRIQKNNIRRVTISLDGGQNGSSGVGIVLHVNSDNEHFEIIGNRIDSVGYNGISAFRTQNLLIKNNVINYSMLSLSDGGGIYIGTNPQDPPTLRNIDIIDNIVMNTISNNEGSGNRWANDWRHGIYLDDGKGHVTVQGNTVLNSGSGIFFHGAHDNKIYDNMLFNNTIANISVQDQNNNQGEVLNNDIRHNYMYQNNGIIYFCADRNNFINFSVHNKIDSNYISAPFSSHFARFRTLVDRITWSKETNFDLHSRAEPVSYAASGAKSPEEFAILVYNPISRDTAILLDHSYMSFKGIVHAGSVHLQPFKSTILFRCIDPGTPLDAPVIGIQLCHAYYVPESLDLSKVDTIIWRINPSAAGSIKSVSDSKGGRVNVEWHNYRNSSVQLLYSVQMNDGSSSVSKPLTVDLEQDIEHSPAPVGTSEITNPTAPGIFTADNPAATEIKWLIPTGVGTLSPYDVHGNTVSVTWRQDILGTYPITYRLKNPCGEWGVESFPLYYSFPVAAPELSNNNLCAGANATFTAKAYHGASNYRWTIAPSEAGSTTSQTNISIISWSPHFSGQVHVSYTVTYSAQESYSSPQTLVVVREIPAKPSMATGANMIHRNHPAETYRATSVGTQYEWTVTPSQAAEIQSQESETASILWSATYFGEATVAYRTMNECGWSDISDPLAVQVQVNKSILFDDIPNIFTPNGDGFNDTWDIPEMRKYPDATVRIFNRAKKMMVQFKGDQMPWNGRDHNGVLLESGYYLYQIEIPGERSIVSGYVTVFR